MTALLDVNVLVALAWPNHVHHSAAREWFSLNHRSGWATCSVTESGFIRVSSNRRAIPDARPPFEAADLLRRMCAIHGHVFLPDEVRPSQLPHELRPLLHMSSQVTDAHLALLARSHDCALASFDRGMPPLADALGVQLVLLST